MKQLLVETEHPQIFIPTKTPQLVESVGGKKRMIVEGIFGKLDAKNENNRRYPRKVFEKHLVGESSFKRRLASRSVLGELEHPDSGNTHLERVSHLILDAWIDNLDSKKIQEMGLDPNFVRPGTYVLGKYEILDTPRGQILRALHEAKVSVGVSSRGRGDVRSVDGIDEVCDDFDLDCWDAVYLPSVVEARPGRIVSEKAEPKAALGSALPQASADQAAAAAGEPVSTGTPVQDWKKEAEEIIRALEDAVTSIEKDLAELVEVLPRGVNLIDQLASVEDPEAVKLKSQALTLIRVLTNKIMQQEAGRKGEKEQKKKKESSGTVYEGSMKDLASTVASQRKKDTRLSTVPMARGDIEAALNKAGHQPTETMIRELAKELSTQGVTADALKYEDLNEADKAKVQCLPDGAIGQISAKKLMKAFEETREANAAMDRPCHCEIRKFIENQGDKDVLVRVCSKGVNGYVVRLLEPGFGESNIFVKWDDVNIPKLSEGKEDSMQVRQMVEALVKENDQLKTQLAELKKVGADKVESGHEDCVPAVRYAAAKKLIAGMIERIKKLQGELVHENKRVRAATKLVHKIVSEKKGEPAKVEEKKPEAPAAKVEEKKPEAPAAKVEEAKKPEVKIASESRDLISRVFGSKKTAAPAQKVEETKSSNLMSATIKKLNG
jgi:hypothetical protein